MALAYPIAATARDALEGRWRGLALNAAEVVRSLCFAAPPVLKIDLLALRGEELDGLEERIDIGVAHGFVQRYGGLEDEIIVAVTFWDVEARLSG